MESASTTATLSYLNVKSEVNASGHKILETLNLFILLVFESTFLR